MPAPDSFSYDLFVSCTAVDLEWVQGFLLPALGLPPERLICNQAGVSGAESFQLGAPIPAEFERAVKTSRYTLLILSQAYLADEWATFSEQLASYAAVAEQRAARLIPVTREQCELPLHLEFRVRLDCTDKTNWEAEAGRLRELLDRPEPKPERIDCPYPGMVPFEAKDARFFYGREDEIQEILQRLRHQQCLWIIGNSGGGKSSLIFAGVLPRLSESGYFAPGYWLVRRMRPGSRPNQEIGEAIGGDPANPGEAVDGLLAASPPTERLLLVIDQFEELFTRAERAEQATFISSLKALHSLKKCALLMNLRTDFLADLMNSELMHSELWSESGNRVEVGPLRGTKLRQAILRPATDVGVYLEPSLLERLMADAAEEPGVLPLLQETMRLLWGRMQRRLLALSSYEQLGGEGRSGLAVAIAQKADGTLAELIDPEKKAIAKRIFLRLVQFGQGRADTRRQQSVAELASAGDPAGFDQTLETLRENRLITLSEGGRVDLAHEALITGWPTLDTWIRERRGKEQIRRRLEEKAQEWKEWTRLGKSGGLLDAVELAEAEQWLDSPDAADLRYSTDLDELVQASRKAIEEAEQQKENARQRELKQAKDIAEAAEARRQAEETARKEAELRSEDRADAAKSLRKRLTISLILGFIALMTAIFAGWEWWQAVAQSRALRTAFGESLVSQGDQAVFDKRWGDAETYYLRGREILKDVGVSTFSADLGLWDVNKNSSPPVMTFGGDKKGASVSAISPDGRLAISGGKTGLRLWELETGREIRTFYGHSDWVTCAAFSGDNRLIISGSQDRTLKVWDVATGRLIRTFLEHNSRVNSLAISHDNRFALSCGSYDKKMHMWEIETGRLVKSFLLDKDSYYVSSVNFSSDDKFIVSGGYTIILWDVSSGRAIRKFSYDDGKFRFGLLNPIRMVIFSHDDQSIISGGADAVISLWHVKTGELKKNFVGHAGDITSLAISADDRFVVSGSFDRTVRQWEVKSGQELRRFVNDEMIASVAITPDNRFVLATGARIIIPELYGLHIEAGMTTKLYCLDPKREAFTFIERKDNEINNMALSPDGRVAITVEEESGNRDNSKITIWDVAAGLKSYVLSEDSPKVTAIAISPDGRHLVVGTKQNAVVLWNIETGKQIRSFTGHTGPITGVAFSPDGRQVLSGSVDKTMKLWDMETGKQIRSFAGHTGPIIGVACSPDGRRVLSGSGDKTMKLWDMETGKQIHSFAGHTGLIFSVAFSPNGRQVLSGGFDETMKLWDMKLWDIETRAEIRSFAPTGSISHMGFLLGGRYAFSTGGTSGKIDNSEACLTFWDVENGRKIHSFFESANPVFMIAVFSSKALVGLTLSEWREKLDRSTTEKWDRKPDIRLWNFGHIDRYYQLSKNIPLAIETLQSNADDGESLRVLGEWYAFNGISDLGIKYLERANTVGGKNFAYATLARLYWLKGELDAAVSRLLEAKGSNELTGFPADLRMRGISSSYLERGLRRYNSEENNVYENTIADLTKAIELAPDKHAAYLSRAYSRRGNAFLQLDKYEQAIADLTTAIKLNPNDIEAYRDRGLVYRMQKEYERALQDLTKSIEIIKKTDGGSYWLSDKLSRRGDVYVDYGKLNEAITDYTRSINVYPKNFSPYLGRGIAYLSMRELQNAMADFSKAIEEAPKRDVSYLYRGLALESNLEFDQAIIDFTKVIELSPQGKSGYISRGNARRAKRDFSGAIGDYTKAIEIDSKDENGFLGRAYSLIDQDNWDKALLDFNEVLKINTKNIDALYYRGLAYRELHDYGKAIEDFTEADRLKPNKIRIILSRAKAYLQQKEIAPGLGDINRLVQIEPEDGGDHYYVALAYSLRAATYANDPEGRRARQLDLNKALGYLKKAVESGVLDFENLQEHDLKPLQSDSRFKQLAEDLHYFRGSNYLKEGNYGRAIKEFTQASQISPGREQVYLARAAALAAEGDWDGASKDYSEALRLNSKNAGTYNSRGLAYRHKGNLERALEDFNQAIQLDPQSASAYQNRGDALHKMGKEKQALADYTKAIELDPSDFNGYLGRARVRESFQDWGGSIIDCSDALKLNSKNAAAYNSRGLAYMHKGDLEHALEDFTQAIKNDPRGAPAYKNRGDVFVLREDVDQAMENFDIARQLNPTDPELVYKRGLVYQKKGLIYQAKEDFAEAIKIRPTYTEAYLSRGRALELEAQKLDREEAKKKWEEAINDYSQALGLDSKNAGAYNSRGFAYMHKGDLEHALEDFTQAIQFDPQSASAYQNLGDALQEMGKAEQALADYTKAIELNPSDFKAYLGRGIIYLNKNSEQALADFGSAIQLDPNKARPRYLRGVAYHRRGNSELAISNLQEAIRLDPDDVMGQFILSSIYREMDDFDRAIKGYSEIIRVKPNWPKAYIHRAEAYKAKKEYDPAIADCTKVILLDPNNINAYLTRAGINLKLGKNVYALSDLVTALQFEPKNTGDHYNIACAYSLRSSISEESLEGKEARKADISKALHHLKMAIKNGYADWKHLKDDSDLDPLRSEQEYRELLEGH